MIECYECGCKIDEDDAEFECPFCGETEMGEGFYICENCGALITYSGDMWECEYCSNEGVTRKKPCHDIFLLDDDDEYCEDGIPDVNQGWVGEHYG